MAQTPIQYPTSGAAVVAVTATSRPSASHASTSTIDASRGRPCALARVAAHIAASAGTGDAPIAIASASSVGHEPSILDAIHSNGAFRNVAIVSGNGTKRIADTVATDVAARVASDAKGTPTRIAEYATHGATATA